MNRTSSLVILIASVTLFCASTIRAEVPAPPVNQTIGVPDVGLEALTEADCRACHSSGVPDRHHMLYGQPVPPGSIVPYPDSDGDGVPDPNYVCLSCHDENFTVVRDCVQCHTQSPHHTTPAAQAGDCVSCHGDIVDNFDDGHYIPTYEPSLTTPSPNGGDGLPLNSRGNGAGACNYCHDDDGLADPVILTTLELHHGTGLNCLLCHPVHGSLSIRICENCHGPDSLHNIQADSPNPDNIGTIVLGGEDAGYGHVGRDAGPGDSDCWGCHGFATAFAPGSGPIIPTIYGVDGPVVSAGVATAVVVTGTGFTNIAGTVQYDSSVELTAADGSSVTLTPDTLVENVLVVTIPADMAPGNYDLRAVKAQFASNPAVISVVPEVIITEATGDGIVTITGRGFGGYAPGSGTRVTGIITSGPVEATVVSWNNTTIMADFGSRPSLVTVSALHGIATYQFSDGADIWRVRVPSLSSEYTVRFSPAGGFLSVEITNPDGSSSIALGIELPGVIFWMDITGNIYFGNIDRVTGTMSGVVFGGPGGSGIWTGDKL